MVNPSVMQLQAKSLTQLNGLSSHRAAIASVGLFCVESIQGKPNYVTLPTTTTPVVGSMEDRRGRT